MNKTDILNMKMASRLTGLTPETLRAWESRYQAISPSRADNGRRIYTMDDIERLRLLARLTQDGMPIGRIASLTNDQLNELYLQSLSKNAKLQLPQGQTEEWEKKAIERTIHKLISALRDFQLEEMSHLLLYARTLLSVRKFILNIVSPLMFQVGNLVTEGGLTIAQEHALSAILRNHLGQILEALRATDEKSGKIIFATQEGCLHEFGILLSAILAQSHGCKSIYLGANVPAMELVMSIRKVEPQVVVLGHIASAHNLLKEPLEDYLNKVGERVPSHVQFLIGGSGHLARNKMRIQQAWKVLRSLDEFDMLASQIAPD